MDPNAEEEYVAFLKKVKRTIFMDNLSPQVTESTLRNALEQYCTVMSVRFVPNYTEMVSIPQCALIEVENPQQEESIMNDVISAHPFMVSGIPRPVRVRPAVAELFDDCPVKPGRMITMRWVDPKHPDFQIAQKIKYRVKEHAAEASFLLKHYLEEEEQLAKQQFETLKANYKNYEMVEAVTTDGTTRRLDHGYNKANMVGDQ